MSGYVRCTHKPYNSVRWTPSVSPKGKKKTPTKNLIYISAKETEVEDKKSKERHRRKPTANSCYAIDMQLYIEKKNQNDK